MLQAIRTLLWDQIKTDHRMIHMLQFFSVDSAVAGPERCLSYSCCWVLATFEQVLSLLLLSLQPWHIGFIGEVLTGDGGGASHPVRWMAAWHGATLIVISVVSDDRDRQAMIADRADGHELLLILAGAFVALIAIGGVQAIRTAVGSQLLPARLVAGPGPVAGSRNRGRGGSAGCDDGCVDTSRHQRTTGSA